MNVMVIGLGSMGKRRIRLLKRFEQIENIIGVDAREDRRQEVLENMGCSVYASIETALQNEKDITSAFICTSPLSHSALINQSLNLNLNVFTEINLVADGYAENIELAKSKNKVLFLSSTFFYREEIAYIRNKLDNKTNINYVYHIGQYLPDWHPWENYKDFFVGDKRTNGCREIMAIELPWIISTFGDVQEFNVMSDNMSKLNLSYKDNYMIQLKHKNNNKGTLIVDVVSPKAVRNLEVYGENMYFSWNGSASSLEEFNTNTKKVENVQLIEDIEHVEGYGSFIVENAYQKEIEEFLNVVLDHKKADYSFEQDLKVLSLIDKIEEA